MEDEDARSVNVNDYNAEEGKLIASLKWLITRIYEDSGIPDKLCELFYRNDAGNLELCPAVSMALTNGSLYSQAASRILRDSSLVNESHGTVLRALSRAVEIEVRDVDGTLVTEMALLASDPIRMSTHLALMDALMTAHMKSIISIERVVHAVSEYTDVDKREEPMDSIDALLFWINKICLLVRDEVEKSDMQFRSGLMSNEITVPEMEDLYEDLCDGTCITALVSFYRPNQIVLTDICFNDPISLQDCRYNLGLLKSFCEMYLPWNTFHFEVDDILYLHESLQPNINAFLADLFFFFEPPPPDPVSAQILSPTQRRFVPIQAIPDLRAQNLANRPMHPPRTRVSQTANRDRHLSLSSQDSLMTNKSTERAYRPTTLPAGAATMSFGMLANDMVSPSDPMGGKDGSKLDPASLTAVRLAMHQRRQEYEQKQFMENSANEAERQKAGKDAFFKLIRTNDNNRGRAQSELVNLSPPGLAMASTTHQTPSRLPAGLNGADPMLARTPSTMIGAPSNPNMSVQPATAREEFLSQQVQSLREQLESVTMGGATRPPTGMSHAISQPSIHNDMMYSPYRPPPVQQQDSHSMYAMPYSHYAPQQPPMYDPQQQMAYAPPPLPPLPPQHSYNPYPTTPNRYGTLPNSGMSYSMYDAGAAQSPYFGHRASFDEYSGALPNANTFHLHQANASNSRLDPPLELKRNLTNWGMTYGVSSRKPRRLWSDNKPSTATATPSHVAAAVDEAVRPDIVPVAREAPGGGPSPSQSGGSLAGLASASISQSRQSVFGAPNGNLSRPHTPIQQSPPRDPTSPPGEQSPRWRNNEPRSPSSITNGNGSDKTPAGFTIADEVDPAMTPEMNAKRAAMYANLMKRKEQIADRIEEKNAQMAEKKMMEIQRQELAEQKKLEKIERRQKLFEEYKRKKLEKEFPELSTGSPTMSARSTSSLQRGHSQPPFVKAQSTMSDVRPSTMQRPSRARSNAGDSANSTPRIHVPSTAEPTLKLFSKHTPKSNRALINNAITYSIFPGAVSADMRNGVTQAMANSDSKHFLVLFRDQKCQYRGLYTWDGASDTAHRLHGTGPKIVKEDMMNLMYKYDSGSKHFNHIPAKHLSPTIDGFTIQDLLWQKPKIPHSGAR